MILGSFRARLTLWNVGVLALVLGAFGAGLCYSVRVILAASVDKQLLQRFDTLQLRWDEARRFGPRGMPGGPGFGPGRPNEGSGPMNFGGGPAFDALAQGEGFFQRLPPEMAEARGPLRPPRLFDHFAQPLFPLVGEATWDPEAALLASAGQHRWSTVKDGVELLRVYTGPLAGGAVVVAQVAYSLAEQERLLGGLVRTLLTLIPLALAVAGAGGAFLAERAIKPVRELTQTAAEIGAHDLSRRLAVTSRDELGRLATTFNAMIARLEEAFRKLESALEQQRRFAGDASHELRTPLTTLKANTSLALSLARTPEDYREALMAADEAADSMNRIVQDLLLLARSDGGRLRVDWQVVDLSALAERAAESVRREDVASVLIRPSGPHQEVLGDRHHLLRLLTNLLENAARHTPPTGRITVEIRPARRASPGCELQMNRECTELPTGARRLKGGRWRLPSLSGPPVESESSGEPLRVVGAEWETGVEVAVIDTGEGIPEEHLPHVCERFYRVDSARSHGDHPIGGGSGLGLAICRTIVEAHRGELRIRSFVGVGTTVSVWLPSSPRQHAEVSCQRVAESNHGTGREV